MKLLFLFSLLLTKTLLAQGFLPHDISILFPMPEEIPTPHTLMAKDFIPKEAFKKIPQLDPKLRQIHQGEHLQLAAIRIDPPEIRLIWQIFSPVGTRVEALDSAVHTFYKMENSSLFLKELQSVVQSTRKDVNLLTPLSVHPTLLKEGFTGKFGRDLFKLIHKSARQDNLFKVTFMALSIAETKWDFGGFLWENSRPSPLTIPKINHSGTQIFINNSFHEFSGGFGPAPKDQDEFNRLVSDSYKSQVREPEKLLRAHLTSKRIENPRLETTETVDCVSCHLAQTARTWIELAEPALVKDNENKFTSKKYILINKTSDPGRTDNVHAFSYFLDMPTINQRTINDTAFVLEKLNR